MFPSSIYSEIIDSLLNSYRAKQQVAPSLPPDQFKAAGDLLRLLIVDGEALDGYIAHVDRTLQGVVLPTDIHYERLCCQIVKDGVEILDPAMLAKILLDPIAVYNIHLCVDRETPEYWRPFLAENGNQLLDKHTIPPFLTTSNGGNLIEHSAPL